MNKSRGLKPLFQKYCRFLTYILLISSTCGQAQDVSGPPPLDRAGAEKLLQWSTFAEPLLWPDWTFPVSIDGTADSVSRRQLNALEAAGVLRRRQEVVWLSHDDGKKTALARQIFEVVDGQMMEENEEGTHLVYGWPQVLNIRSVSDPYEVQPYWYVEVQVEWYVTRQAHWLQLPEIRRTYLARRSLESRQKPFNRSLFFQYDGKRWGYWQPPQP